MENSLINQSPLFNLTNVGFFDLALNANNPEWEKFVDDMLLCNYYCFRESHRYSCRDSMIYFLFFLEGKFIVLKCDIIVSLICKMKTCLNNKNMVELDRYYISFVNISRVVIIYLINLLMRKDIKLCKDNIFKFLKMDNELDGEEKHICDKIIKYDTIKKKIDTEKIIDIQAMIAMFPKNDGLGCIIC